MKRLALIAALILLTASQARAAEAVPGSSCAGYNANSFQWAGASQNGGVVNGMFCNGGTNLWAGIINFQSGGNVGIGTTTPTSNLAFTGQSAQTLGMERETTAATGGNNLTITAGGATSGATNKAGGNLILQSGVSTGQNPFSIIYFNTSNSWASSTTADQVYVAVMMANPWGLTIQPSVNDYTTGWLLDAAELTVYDNNSYGSAGKSQAYFDNFNNGTAGARIRLMHERNLQGALHAADEVDTYEFTGNDAGINIVDFATIRANTVTIGNGTADGKLTFTALKAGVSTDQMVLDQNGQVGIGQTSPATKLDVNGDITNENVKSCAQLGTDGNGKLVCQTPRVSGSSCCQGELELAGVALGGWGRCSESCEFFSVHEIGAHESNEFEEAALFF